MIHVEWSDAPISAYVSSFRGRVGSMRIEYTLEIVPNTSEAALKNHHYRRDSGDWYNPSDGDKNG